MTAYVTRSPLQLLTNPHMMSDSRRPARRTSARLADKEDAPVVNGFVHAGEKGKGGQTNGAAIRHNKSGVNGTKGLALGGRGKRKLDYDEEDDGFMFTRTRSKRAKATQMQPPEPVVEEVQEEAPRPAPAKQPRKKSLDTPDTPPIENEVKGTKRRRSARNSADHNFIELPPLEVKKRRAKEHGNVKPKQDKVDQESRGTGRETQYDEGIAAIEKPSDVPVQHVEVPRDTTKIALPFADTPIIRRNQEMRRGAGDGHRRSSLGMRGRRASSLIDSGKSNALPHDEVESSEFYKHIESDSLPEPRRMRQLLTWCGTRALGNKPSFSSEDSHAKLAAREIQQQLLKDFSTRSEMSDWFSREETNPHPQPPKPNPKNISNLNKIQELEQQIARLQSERQTWETLLRPPANTLSLSPLTPDILPIPAPSSISPSLLSSPTQTAILQTFDSFSQHPPFTHLPSSSSSLPNTTTTTTTATTTTTSAATRLRNLLSDNRVEFEIDKFAANVHLLRQYRDAADSVATEVLGMSARALEERDRVGRRADRGGGGDGEVKGEGETGIREVLRGLSRVVDR